MVAALLIKAIGKQLICVHVNHGLMRKGESEQVVDVFQNQLDANLVVRGCHRPLPRAARRRGRAGSPSARSSAPSSSACSRRKARKVGDEVSFLAQGTIYPDILESDGVKAHHNVGGLPDDLQFELCEPGEAAVQGRGARHRPRAGGMPEGMVERQPFPARVAGRALPRRQITRDRLEALREADAILRDEFAAAGLEGKVWQYFVSVPDFRATGVRDGVRAFESRPSSAR